MPESAEQRTHKAGYPRGTAEHIREEAGAEGRAGSEQRYADRWRREA